MMLPVAAGVLQEHVALHPARFADISDPAERMRLTWDDVKAEAIEAGFAAEVEDAERRAGEAVRSHGNGQPDPGLWPAYAIEFYETL